MTASPTLAPQTGFSYIAMLIVLAILTLTATATVQVGALLERRAAEEELLSIGQEFRNAFIFYANATVPGQTRFPKTLADLLKDPRYPNPRRYLRKVYADPLTGSEEWGLVPSLDGKGIIGVYSLSDAKPIKIDHFEKGLESFSVAVSYRDWRFLGPVDTGAPLKPTSPLAPPNQVPPNQVPTPNQPNPKGTPDLQTQ